MPYFALLCGAKLQQLSGSRHLCGGEFHILLCGAFVSGLPSSLRAPSPSIHLQLLFQASTRCYRNYATNGLSRLELPVGRFGSGHLEGSPCNCSRQGGKSSDNGTTRCSLASTRTLNPLVQERPKVSKGRRRGAEPRWWLQARPRSRQCRVCLAAALGLALLWSPCREGP